MPLAMWFMHAIDRLAATTAAATATGVDEHS